MKEQHNLLESSTKSILDFTPVVLRLTRDPSEKKKEKEKEKFSHNQRIGKKVKKLRKSLTAIKIQGVPQ